jgi:hypothetical protein
MNVSLSLNSLRFPNRRLLTSDKFCLLKAFRSKGTIFNPLMAEIYLHCVSRFISYLIENTVRVITKANV